MRRIVHSVHLGTTVVAGLTSVLSLAAVVSDRWWIAELCGHFRPHYAALLILCTPVLIWRYRYAASAVLIPIVFNLAPVLPLYQPSPPPSPGRVWSVLHYNLDRTAADHTATFAYLREHPADILLLQEVTPELEQRITAALPDYRLVFSYPLDTTQGSALLLPRSSPIQVQSAEIIHLPASSSRPMLLATLDLDGQALRLLSMQATRPRSAGTSAFQQMEFEALAQWSRAQQSDEGRALMLIGDINTTPWSARFVRLVRDGGLRDSTTGYGIQPTWPATGPLLLGIPIDHALVDARVVVVGRQVGPALDGDHTPLIVQFTLSPS